MVIVLTGNQNQSHTNSASDFEAEAMSDKHKEAFLEYINGGLRDTFNNDIANKTKEFLSDTSQNQHNKSTHQIDTSRFAIYEEVTTNHLNTSKTSLVDETVNNKITNTLEESITEAKNDELIHSSSGKSNSNQIIVYNNGGPFLYTEVL